MKFIKMGLKRMMNEKKVFIIFLLFTILTYGIFFNSKMNNKKINFTILNGKTISIDKNRFENDDGTNQLNTRWKLNEVDDILLSLKGTWQIDQYAGFVVPTLYYPDLYDFHDNIETKEKEQIYKMYNDKVEKAQVYVPTYSFSIKEKNGEEQQENYIYVNDFFKSPMSISMSLDSRSDYYPIFSNRTTYTDAFTVEYPVLYIQFFVEDREAKLYTPATFVISADKKFYVLIDGAYYSLKKG